MAMHVTGPLISSQGNYITVPMAKYGGTHAAASGTVVPRWRATLPAFPMELNGVGITFGVGSAPQGGAFVVKVWSNGIRKGLASLSVAGGTTPSASAWGLSYTLPASSLVSLTVHTVGGTAAGGGGQPSLQLRHRG